MIKSILTTSLSILWVVASAQFVAKMEVKEPIPGLCNDQEVYAIFPSFKGHEEAVCPLKNKYLRG